MIWGAAGGIGRALSSLLLSEGHAVYAIGHAGAAHRSQIDLIAEADVAEEYSVRQAVLSVAHEAYAIDLMVYAVGDIMSARVTSGSDDAWQRIIQANLVGAYLTTHHSLPLLAPDATIMYLGARHERLRIPGLSAYAAAKAGLEALAETLTKEERQRKIVVVRPDAVATPLWDKVPLRLPKHANTPESLAEKLLQTWVQGMTGVVDL